MNDNIISLRMNTATLTSKGQITIPKAIRRQFGLMARHKVLFLPKSESVEMIPVKGNILDLYGALHSKKIKKVRDWGLIRQEVKRRMIAKRTHHR